MLRLLRVFRIFKLGKNGQMLAMMVKVAKRNSNKICINEGRNLATLNLALLIFEKLKVPIVFPLELKLSKTLRGLVYFVLYLYGGEAPPITAM